MKYKPVKTAVIGCGMISGAYLSTMTTKFKILDVVACFDRHPEKAQATALKYNLKVMPLEEILADQSIELVVNLTAAPAHYQLVKTLLEHGKHVYSEKTLAITLEEAQELLELADTKNLYLGVAPDTFLGSSLQTAKYVVDSGLIGKVTSCYAAITRDINLFAGLAPITTKVGGGIAFDLGIYYVAALLSILGPVKTVTGFMSTLEPDRKHIDLEKLGEPYTIGCENQMAGTLVFANGAMGNLLFDSNSIITIPEKPGFVIYGTMGLMYLSDPNLFGGEVKVILKGNSEPFVMQQSHPFKEECRGLGAAELAWSLRQGRSPRASKEMAYHAMEVLHGIDISGKTGSHYPLQSDFEIPAALPRGFEGGEYFSMIEESAIAL